MAALKRRHNRWEAKVRVPKAVADESGKSFLYRTIATADKRTAQAEADAWEALLRAEWAEQQGHSSPALRAFRYVYARVREQAERGDFLLIEPQDEEFPVSPELAGISHEIEQLAEAAEGRELSEEEAGKLAALQDASLVMLGRKVRKRDELELPFSEVAAQYMVQWRTQQGLKPSNTEQQKLATFRLFQSFWKDAPMRGIGEKDAAAFHDALAQLSPSWARSPSATALGWTELLKRFGGNRQGLAQATINRHMATLKTLWAHARRRGHCSGDNPFDGFRKALRGANEPKSYLAWTDDELRKLLALPPKRGDLRELIVVAMYSGLRLNEAASLTWGQVREEDGIPCFDVQDAKTKAGKRLVPLHPALSWLAERSKGKPQERVWPRFNAEGPGKKPGADAGRDFSDFKLARGFTDRRKVFHSFRKNVTQQAERAQVPVTDWQQIIGHEKGLTYGVYGGALPMARKLEIISTVAYPKLEQEIARFLAGEKPCGALPKRTSTDAA